MRKPTALMIVSLLLVMSWITFMASPPYAADAANPQIQKWEYKAVLMQSGDDELAAIEEQFNQLGEQGWELSQIQLRAAIFKRPKQ